MGREAHVRLAWTMQAPGQGLGKSQPPRPRIPTSRVDQAHAEKAMQSNMIFPDRLLASSRRKPGHIIPGRGFVEGVCRRALVDRPRGMGPVYRAKFLTRPGR